MYCSKLEIKMRNFIDKSWREYKTLKLKVTSSASFSSKRKTQVHSLNLSHALKFHCTSYRNVPWMRYGGDGISASGKRWRHLQMRIWSEGKKQLQSKNLSLRWKKPETLQLQFWAEKRQPSFKKVFHIDDEKWLFLPWANLAWFWNMTS